MLCLGVKINERIRVTHAGETLEVVILPRIAPHFGKRIGFDGPRSFAIVREGAINQDVPAVESRPMER